MLICTSCEALVKDVTDTILSEGLLSAAFLMLTVVTPYTVLFKAPESSGVLVVHRYIHHVLGS